MKRTLRLFGLVMTVLLVCSRPAEAGLGWWDWLEDLSGPGIFRGKSNVLISGLCFPRSSEKTDLLGIPGTLISAGLVQGRLVTCLYFDARALSSEPDARFNRVDVTLLEFGLTFPVRRSIELGAGIGRAHFKSDGGEQGRLTVTPLRVVLKPIFWLSPIVRLANPDYNLNAHDWPAVLKFYAKETVITGRQTGEDFGVDREVFNAKNDIVTSFGAVIDVGELLGLIRR